MEDASDKVLTAAQTFAIHAERANAAQVAQQLRAASEKPLVDETAAGDDADTRSVGTATSDLSSTPDTPGGSMQPSEASRGGRRPRSASQSSGGSRGRNGIPRAAVRTWTTTLTAALREARQAVGRSSELGQSLVRRIASSASREFRSTELVRRLSRARTAVVTAVAALERAEQDELDTSEGTRKADLSEAQVGYREGVDVLAGVLSEIGGSSDDQVVERRLRGLVADLRASVNDIERSAGAVRETPSPETRLQFRAAVADARSTASTALDDGSTEIMSQKIRITQDHLEAALANATASLRKADAGRAVLAARDTTLRAQQLRRVLQELGAVDGGSERGRHMDSHANDLKIETSKLERAAEAFRPVDRRSVVDLSAAIDNCRILVREASEAALIHLTEGLLDVLSG